MLTPEQISAIRDQATSLTDPVNSFIIKDIARRISEAGQLTSTASYQVWRAQQLGVSQREIEDQLCKLLKVSRRELRRLLTQSAEVGYDFDIKRFPMKQAVPFSENYALQRIVQAAVDLAGKDFDNITQTLGLLDHRGQALPLREAYTSAMDHAFKLVSTGAADYNTAIRRATKNLAQMGLVSIDYASGIHTSLEAAVRRSLMGGLGLMVEQTQQVTHDQLGCDGWELSAHANSAPDHEPIQGKQFSDAEYKAINSHLVRRIGTLNCGHIAFPVILGVNAPQYSQEDLDRMREDNENGITYQGRHYTGYEASQLQRRLERRIREQKRRVLVSEVAGDKEKLTVNRIRLRRLTDEYTRFSKVAGLRTQAERMQKAGFGKSSAAQATGTTARFDNFTERLRGTETKTGVTVQDVSPHVFGRMLERGVPEDAVVEALTASLKTGKIRSDRSQRFVGARATVAVNIDTGKVVTVWPTSSKLVEKLKKEGGSSS